MTTGTQVAAWEIWTRKSPHQTETADHTTDRYPRGCAPQDTSITILKDVLGAVFRTTTMVDEKVTAATWLADFAHAIYQGDAQQVAATFMPEGWLRDVLTFSWDTRSLRGREAIVRYLSDGGRLAEASVTNISLEAGTSFAPCNSFTRQGEHVGVETGFTYETVHCVGRGYAHLRLSADGTWRAITLAMIALNLKAHPEPENVAAGWESRGKSWTELEAERTTHIETSPQVLIVGAGQCGLMTASRFRQMNIPALVIDKNDRIGDNWRKRYRSLALHTPNIYSPMLYQPFPTHWPVYAPKDPVADWFESYAQNQLLTVWTKSTFAERPTYDAKRGVWRAVVDRNGTEVELHPKHIVLATGTLGQPRIPVLPGRDRYRGTVIHAADFIESSPFVGKRVVVVGAGNSSIDVCQDLATSGAASVTMIQRSQTVVVSRSSVNEDLRHFWRPGEPVEVGDFKYSAVPLGYFKEVNQSMTDALWARETVLHEKLRKGGLKLHQGPENEGQFLMYFSRSGGYWLDKGGADLIADGRIKIKQGSSPTAFTSDGLAFDDGSTIPADAIIFATGYDLIRSVNKRTFGKEVIDQTCEVWGFDRECEIQGCFRPTGHPGLWYAVGDFFNCRFMSKQLAILIKAAELGLYDVTKVQQEVSKNVPNCTAKI